MIVGTIAGRPRPILAVMVRLLLCVLLVALGSMASLAAADNPTRLLEWRNARGTRFRAAPVEALGPFALFGPEAATNRVLKFRALSGEDCVTFHEAVAARPARAARWADAQGELTRELLRCVQPVSNGDGAATDVGSLPEPELLLVYYHTADASREEAAAQDAILHSFEPFARRVRRIYPGRVEVVVAVARPGVQGPPSASSVWMTAAPEQLAEVGALRRFIPVVTSGLLLISREGVPIAAGGVHDLFSLARMLDHASALLWDLNPGNPRTLPDRAHYRRAVRPVEFARGSSPPEMLAAPVSAELLRAHGLSGLEARIEIDAEGGVSEVVFRNAAPLPAFVAETLRAAIRRSGVFLPAIREGTPVAGTFELSLAVPSVPDLQLAAETAWVQGEARARVPIPGWLVLRPIRVGEQVFTSVDRVHADGTVVLQPVKAGTAKVDSFWEDWFDRAGGAASVQPAAGRQEEIDGASLTWQRVVPEQGFVDLARGIGDSDACVGYAWTEIDSPVDTAAWLGIGSDDGLKVWVNGRLVLDAWRVRPSRLDDDVVPFRLTAGKNRILVKVQNETGSWGFIARVRTQER